MNMIQKAEHSWFGILCYSYEHEYSAFDKNVRRSTRMFGVRQECSAFEKTVHGSTRMFGVRQVQENVRGSVFYGVLE